MRQQKRLHNRRRSGGRAASGRFAPGQSGNPAGRPPEPESFTAALRRRGAELVEVDTPQGVQLVTRIDALALRLYELADAGSVRAHALVLERLDGKPAQSVSVSAEVKAMQPKEESWQALVAYWLQNPDEVPTARDLVSASDMVNQAYQAYLNGCCAAIGYDSPKQAPVKSEEIPPDQVPR